MNRNQGNIVRWACACLALCGCGSDTEGRIVSVALSARGEALPDEPLGSFTTHTGWEVKLDRAELAVDAIYAFAPEQRETLASKLSRIFVPVARAHGGHDPLSGQRVSAELHEPFVLDLLSDEPQLLGEVSAEAGPIVQLAIDLAVDDSPASDELGHAQARLAGQARRGDEIVRFEGSLDVPDEGTLRRIEIAMNDAVLDQGVLLELSVRPSLWLNDAELDRLMAGDGDAAREIHDDDQVGRAWLIGARKPAAYSARLFSEEERDD